MLSNKILPCSIPLTIEAKLSSIKIISAASFVTSLPEMFMDTPMLAILRAGASFTPSPVTATRSPTFFRLSTMISLWVGDTLAKTSYWYLLKVALNFISICSGSSCIHFRMSSPLMTVAWLCSYISWSTIPTFLAMARAVVGWSPNGLKHNEQLMHKNDVIILSIGAFLTNYSCICKYLHYKLVALIDLSYNFE